MGNLKEILYRELELKIITGVEGINFDPHIFKHLDLGGRYQEDIHFCMEFAHETHVVSSFRLAFFHLMV